MRGCIVILVGALLFAAGCPAASPLGPLGRGSLATTVPDELRPPPPQYFEPGLGPPFPSNRWWSSLAVLPFSERQYPHPLAVAARPEGFQVAYPGPSIHADERCICGWIDWEPARDLVLGHSAVSKFESARVGGYSDWFVTAVFRSSEPSKTSMEVSYGHGSPFVYARFRGGNPVLRFPTTPEVWYQSRNGEELGICLGESCYALFAAPGSTWSGVGTDRLENRGDGEGTLTIALLPDNGRRAALELFSRYARNRVLDTRSEWSYEPASHGVRVHLQYDLQPPGETLFALYPHQLRDLVRDSVQVLPEFRYRSVRGPMILAVGEGFELFHPFPGVLPALPRVADDDPERLRDEVRRVAESGDPVGIDTYNAGKHLGKLAALRPIAEQLGGKSEADRLGDRLRKILEAWFRADSKGDIDGAFFYDPGWGTLLGHPSSYGADTQLNDHHFHYGYFLRAAAEIARTDPEWLGGNSWGPMVDLLVRDIATPTRDDPHFPFLRNFDPYAGHSWASGFATFGDGNNQESSSEAMAAWTGLILLGEMLGRPETRDLGIYLYSSELAAIESYWFDVSGQNHPPAYKPEVVTMVWGGKGANETWWTADPEQVHGINWLPFHGGSLYLGRHPDYVARNYQGLVRARGGDPFRSWRDLILMYRALEAPAEANAALMRDWETIEPEAGNTRAHTYHWITNLQVLGQVDASNPGDYPLSIAFRRGAKRSYVVYNPGGTTRVVRFQDGTRIQANPNGFTVK